MTTTASEEVARLFAQHVEQQTEIAGYMTDGGLDYKTALLLYNRVHNEAMPTRPSAPWRAPDWHAAEFTEKRARFERYMRRDAAWLRRERRFLAALEAVCR